LGELTALPKPVAAFKGPTSNRRERKKAGEERRGKEGDGKGRGEGMERKGGKDYAYSRRLGPSKT